MIAPGMRVGVFDGNGGDEWTLSEKTPPKPREIEPCPTSSSLRKQFISLYLLFHLPLTFIAFIYPYTA